MLKYVDLHNDVFKNLIFIKYLLRPSEKKNNTTTGGKCNNCLGKACLIILPKETES